jgi:hypothetical protein
MVAAVAGIRVRAMKIVTETKVSSRAKVMRAKTRSHAKLSVLASLVRRSLRHLQTMADLMCQPFHRQLVPVTGEAMTKKSPSQNVHRVAKKSSMTGMLKRRAEA